MKAGLPAAFANSAPRRDPTTGEISGGFPCGPADIELFDELFYRSTQGGIEIANAITQSGQTPDDGNLTQLWQAITGAFSKAANGYVALPSGIIIQWGTVTVPSASGATSNSVSITWPTAFPTACRSVAATPTRGANAANGYLPTTGVSGLSTTGASLTIDTLTGSSGSAITITQSVACVWIAIGY